MERVKFTREFIFRASPQIVHQFLTTPACLTRWFCDEVDIMDTSYTFVWNGSEEVAELIENEEPNRLRFKWEDAESEEEFLEFDIQKSPVTNETIVNITDFADEDEVEDQVALWTSQMKRMREETGG